MHCRCGRASFPIRTALAEPIADGRVLPGVEAPTLSRFSRRAGGVSRGVIDAITGDILLDALPGDGVI